MNNLHKNNKQDLNQHKNSSQAVVVHGIDTGSIDISVEQDTISSHTVKIENRQENDMHSNLNNLSLEFNEDVMNNHHSHNDYDEENNSAAYNFYYENYKEDFIHKSTDEYREFEIQGESYTSFHDEDLDVLDTLDTLDENLIPHILDADIKDNLIENKQEENISLSVSEVNKENVLDNTLSNENLNTSEEKIATEPWEKFEQGIVIWGDFNRQEQEKIVRHYAPKIRYIAYRMKGKLPKSVELNELISSGTIGLMEALSKFKPQLAIRFDSYAESRIRGSMIDELRRLDWFPRSLRSKARQIEQANWKLEHELGRSPTTKELADFTSYEEKDVDATLEAIQGQLCVPLENIQDIIPSDGGTNNEENPYQSTAFHELLSKIAGLIETLTPREKMVLSLHYTDELNMRETAEVMEVTEGRVSQLHTQAINKLRKIFAEQYHDSL